MAMMNAEGPADDVQLCVRTHKQVLTCGKTVAHRHTVGCVAKYMASIAVGQPWTALEWCARWPWCIMHGAHERVDCTRSMSRYIDIALLHGHDHAADNYLCATVYMMLQSIFL